MARTAVITLDEKQYTVHAFNLKELQTVGDILEGGATQSAASKILGLALRRAEPAVENIDLLEPTIPEVTAATAALLKLSGIGPENPQTAAPATS